MGCIRRQFRHHTPIPRYRPVKANQISFYDSAGLAAEESELPMKLQSL